MDHDDLGIDTEEIEVEGSDPITKFPKYVPPHRGKAKVPKDIGESKVTLYTPLLLEKIVFEGLQLGWILVLKLEDLDLADTKPFPHLVID